MNWKCLQSRFCLWETNLVPWIRSQKIWPSCVFRSTSPWLSEPQFPQAKTGTLSQTLSLRLFYTSILSLQGGFRSLSREDPLKKEMARHSSILAWRIPWTEEPGRLQPIRSQTVGHDWAHAESKRLKSLLDFPVLFHQRVLLLQMLTTSFHQRSRRTVLQTGANGHFGGIREFGDCKRTTNFSPLILGTGTLGAGKAQFCHLLVTFCIAAPKYSVL